MATVSASSSPISGKNVVVTGANRGIGLELTKQLLARNNHVIAASRDPDSAAELLKLVSNGAKLTLTKLDVTDFPSIQKWAQSVKASVPHIDVVVNNAGVYSGQGSSLSTVSPDEMLVCFQANTMGPLFVTQQLMLSGLIGQPGTNTLVANMTSKMGSVSDNGSGGSYAYRASKAALNIVNKSLSIDLGGKGVTAVLLHPGWVKTDMTRGTGLITTQQCVEGLLSVLESGRPLDGRWYDYAGKEIMW